MENSRVCKVCGEPLSSFTKGNVCEHCKNEKANKRKGIAKGVIGAATTIGGIILTVVKFVPGVGDKNSRG